MPTGTGDLCSKLLHYAATHGLKPLAMAEFWGKVLCGQNSGEFWSLCGALSAIDGVSALGIV